MNLIPEGENRKSKRGCKPDSVIPRGRDPRSSVWNPLYSGFLAYLGTDGSAFLCPELAPDGVFQAPRIAPRTGELLPRLFTIAGFRKEPWAVSLSVALSCRSPRPVVSRHPDPWCPDFPQAFARDRAPRLQ